MVDKTEGHKRSKSALALSILHRDKSKSDDNKEDGATSPNNGSPVSSSSSSPRESRHSHSASMISLRSSKRKAAQDNGGNNTTNIGNCPEIPEGSVQEEMEESRPRHSTAEAGHDSSSISLDQSVRTFRLFEVLRSGDTNAITKAVKEYQESSGQEGATLGTSILHLAIQCADPQVVEFVLASVDDAGINARDREGNTPLHLAAQLGRLPVVRELLERPAINDAATNFQGQTPLDLARNPDIFQHLQLARSLFVDTKTREIQSLVGQEDYEKLERVLVEPRVQGMVDMNAPELVTDRTTYLSGGTLLHEAVRKKDTKLIQVLLMHGADPFRRDRKGKLPQDITKDDRIRSFVKKSPAAVMAQRGIQEKAILGNNFAQGSGEVFIGGKDAREIKGYLKKWTNYTTGYKLRWFVLEDGVLSYYKHQDDAGSACRGAINMRIAKLNMDAQDKTRFEILGKSSVKYHLKANHVVEAKRWFWALNNAIQWAKDEAKESDKRRTKDVEVLRQARMEQIERQDQDTMSTAGSKLNDKTLAPPAASFGSTTTPSGSKLSLQISRGGTDNGFGDDEGSVTGVNDLSTSQSNMARVISHVTTNTAEGDGEDDYADYTSSREIRPASDKDAFSITAQSVRLQLDILRGVSSAINAEKAKNPSVTLSDPTIAQGLTTYGRAVDTLNSLIVDLLKISRDRDAYWQYRLDREADARKMWEDSMARVAREHEDLQNRMGESEDKRRRTKKALREALENVSVPQSRRLSQTVPPSQVWTSDAVAVVQESKAEKQPEQTEEAPSPGLLRKKTVLEEMNLSDSDSDDEEEFFDAIDAGDVEVVVPTKEEKIQLDESSARAKKESEIAPSFKGYEDEIRKRLKMEADDRPKVSLWGILKSMIGKDMTKMTLPVSFNEPTSLLQRVAEDMEYTDLIDTAADRPDSLERMVYVAAFAASEYASTIGRVAKPFNPLLGETYEYARPDKGYRFFVEQVSHHPPIGAAYAESPRWDYYGESAVKSKFYGKSFDINPLGTWFLRLRPASGGEELYTWKKVTSSVIGIITGNPTVDNYGPMVIKNWTTGEVCNLDFKPRGWTAASAYHVSGKVLDKDGVPHWSVGGRWNDKIYARKLSHGASLSASEITPDGNSPHAMLIWQSNPRPTGIPFNLTPFVVTLNAIPDNLKPHLPPTDTRLRPDQRAMEDGEYDFAATEKHRVEEKQRAKRRDRESKGEEYQPKWFSKGVCDTTGEEYWVYNGSYWKSRAAGDWSVCEDIF
ncbi:hypothetical protein H112_02303 [Trichophyton rubrum D6]|uniref:PH domain-containing protein n=2 Tax=Trichophyton rubrum TaxID=5551 RepID=F2SUB8_TRIRC|nr:uncharacterized protein TERG_06067 [Trichophyton rubrum CBS 118892]EZF44425.1 hypothetical protein H102_02299 [Trichophyton rubrum CBS 100081]EZF55067.1 hypothetical protein H103_02312 [Trichophyton rubrum CBS 288.86]EZF65659.1 hypothetical protein H104_02285 [Trichophyton rubrum CBS 289.86]EZF86997.1 hypothetical protein H110_02307 [Trichophyton rubrum MR1448]EZF97772.1 hypothetical protein H113_02313 [Trichophyton rubrum MR1459]EZG19316.1 hypothetical protein H107_02380 [Trichophyton rub